MNKSYLFTSESVSEGHPDKICDQISDAILDEALRQDPESRVACETYISTGFVLVGGEITTKGYIDTEKIVRTTLADIGYTSAEYGIDSRSCGILTLIKPQSEDISQGVTVGEGLHKEQGAGDQGMMFGYACDETENFMPLPIELAHNLVYEAAQARKSNEFPFLRPDSKCQVTVRYEDGEVKDVDTIVFSHQHDPVDHEVLSQALHTIINRVIPSKWLNHDTAYYLNPTGRFIKGGPEADVGLTGRKIIVDTYGGIAAHGGGAFSGKDPSKVDRSGAYMARYLAKHVVAAGFAKKAQVQLSYAIGVAHPISVNIDTFSTATVDERLLEQGLNHIFDLSPAGIVNEFQLKRPIYKQTASYGHFGKADYPWEQLKRLDEFKQWIANQ